MSRFRATPLEGPRLILEPLSMEHTEGMFELWSRPEVCEHSGPALDSAGCPIALPAGSSQESDRLIQFWLDRAAAGTGFRWAVEHNADGRFLGAVGFNQLGRLSEYAVHFVPRFWGAGFASEASRLALSWLRAAGCEQVEAFIEPLNQPSIRLFERLGFESAGAGADGTIRFVLDFSASRSSPGALG